MTEQAEQVTQTAQNSGKTQTSLEIRHLVKRYANADKPVLDDISFDVPHGKVFVIVGRPDRASRRCCAPSQVLSRFRAAPSR